MITLSDTQLSELEKKLSLLDREADGFGFMSLDLGDRVGLTTGYPQLRFAQIQDEFVLHTVVPSTEPGYDTMRDIGVDEMLTFVLVAKRKFPNKKLTKELIKKVRVLLTQKKNEMKLALEQIEESLHLIES